MDNSSEFLWRAFAATGDPTAYLNFTHSRRNEPGFEGRSNENTESTGFGA
jgi:hypothetical protein